MAALVFGSIYFYQKGNSVVRSTKKQTALIAGLSIFVLTACSGQMASKIVCSEANLELMGERDALGGKTEKASLIKDSCEKEDKIVDVKTYSDAYKKNVPVFCSKTEPFDYGFSGKDYENICDLEFDDSYALGRGLFDAKHQIWKAQNEVDRLKRLKNTASQGRFGAKNTDDYQRKIRDTKRSIAFARAEQIQLRKQAVEKGFLK